MAYYSVVQYIAIHHSGTYSKCRTAIHDGVVVYHSFQLHLLGEVFFKAALMQ